MSTVLKDLRTKKEIKLPQSGGTVVMYEDMLTGDALNQLTATDDKQKAINILISLIESWDFTDESGVQLEVNVDSINKLPLRDFVVLSQVVADVVEGQTLSKDIKKNT